jgi:actin-related protein 6
MHYWFPRCCGRGGHRVAIAGHKVTGSRQRHVTTVADTAGQDIVPILHLQRIFFVAWSLETTHSRLREHFMPRATKTGARVPPGLPAKTFILDNGSYSVKAGFAPKGDEDDETSLLRCHIIPNSVVKTRDRKIYVASQMDQNVTQWSEAVFRRPVEHGQVVSWEAQKEIWDFSFFDERTAHKDLLIAHPEDTTLIFSENPNALPALQRNADEIIMEEWGFCGYMRTLSRYASLFQRCADTDAFEAPCLNSYNDLHPLFEDYQSKRPATPAEPMECLLIIDSGYSSTSITPTFNGRPLHRAIRRLDLGGKHICQIL